MARLIGIDVSHWQGRMDWLKARDGGVSFGIFKISDHNKSSGAGFYDTQCDANYRGTRDQNIINGGYHWLQASADPTVQATYYYGWWKNNPTDMVVLDFEEQKIISANDMLWRAQVWLNIIEEKTGKLPIIYTAKWYFDKIGITPEKSSWMYRYPLWVAQYPSIIFPWTQPYIPSPWKDLGWTMWQYTSNGDGRARGASSLSIDENFWRNDSYDDLFAFATGGVAPPPPPPPPPQEDPILQGEVTTDELNIREKPTTASRVAGKLYRGAKAKIYALSGREAWGKISDEQYVALRYNNSELVSVKPVESEPNGEET